MRKILRCFIYHYSFFKNTLPDLFPSHLGLAVIGVNNPFIPSAETNDYIVCPSMPHELLDDVDNDNYQGIVYACTVQDLAAVFENVAALGLPSDLGVLESNVRSHKAY